MSERGRPGAGFRAGDRGRGRMKARRDASGQVKSLDVFSSYYHV